MFRIGVFSKMNKITVKTLRYYDELGLLTPCHVDRIRDTGTTRPVRCRVSTGFWP